MRKLLLLLALLVIALGTWQCSADLEGTTISGKITGAENLQVFIDKVVYGKANAVIGKEEIAGNGNFSINFPEGLKPGIYNVRIGAKRISLILDKPEKKINVEGDLATMQNYQVQVDGSASSKTLVNTMQSLLARKMSSNDIKTFVDTTTSPILASYVSYRALGENGTYLPIHKAALDKLTKADPGSELAAGYTNWVSAVDQVYRQQLMRERVQVGKLAPDIKLQDPYGKEFALSDLKGQVVLLDFWASWCGPCRRENPNVVAVYNKYKDRGFTIFSVSLDGIDNRTAARLDEKQSSDMMDNQRQRWVNAIAQDKLTWPYHVSDLKKWDCSPAKDYGVSSIPRAFMIDREGVIVSTSVRGARQIEQELLKHI